MNTAIKIVFVKQALELYLRKTIQLVDTHWASTFGRVPHLFVESLCTAKAVSLIISSCLPKVKHLTYAQTQEHDTQHFTGLTVVETRYYMFESLNLLMPWCEQR